MWQTPCQLVSICPRRQFFVFSSVSEGKFLFFPLSPKAIFCFFLCLRRQFSKVNVLDVISNLSSNKPWLKVPHLIKERQPAPLVGGGYSMLPLMIRGLRSLRSLHNSSSSLSYPTPRSSSGGIAVHTTTTYRINYHVNLRWLLLRSGNVEAATWGWHYIWFYMLLCGRLLGAGSWVWHRVGPVV